jgi:hypothetical protein
VKKIISFVFCFCCFIPKVALAADIVGLESRVQELSQMVGELKLLVESQQREIATLKQANQAPQYLPAQGPPAPGSRLLQGRWNPDIGLLADTTLKLDSPKEDAEGADRVSVRELELIVGSPVDPYSRLDVTLSFSDFEEASLEEAYYTHFGLPWGMTGRVGKFKPRVGKAIQLHRDSLDTIDEPLVIQRYFGVEGYNKSGADLKKILDLPWPSAHEVSLGVLEGGNGEDGTLFGATRRHPTLYSHLKNYWDLNDATGLELGVSYLAGSRDDDEAFEMYVLGLDGTLIHRFGDRQHFKVQSEAFRVSRAESFAETAGAASGEVFFNDLDDNRNLWGAYVLADLRFLPQWAAGFRFDRVELVDDAIASPDTADVGYTGYLTFYQSEFARWRAQFTHLDLSSGKEDNQILLQGTFAIGEHKHKLQ